MYYVHKQERQKKNPKWIPASLMDSNDIYVRMYAHIYGEKIYVPYIYAYVAMYVDPYMYAGTYLLNLCTCLTYFPLPDNMGSILLGKKCLFFW